MRHLLLFLLAMTVATAADPFELVIKTDNIGSSGPTQFTLPLKPGLTYDFTVDWGDGNSSNHTNSNSPTHTYSSVGIHTVSITENVVGGFSAIYFNDGGDKLKVLALSQWGDVTWSTFEGAFWGCQNMTITATDEATANTGGVSNFDTAWFGCHSLLSFPLIDTGAGTSFISTWNNCNGLTTFPLIDTSAGTIFEYTWSNCSGLTSFPLIDTSAAEDLGSAWSGCSGLTEFPAIDTSACWYFAFTWQGCSSLTSFPLIDTSAGIYFLSTWQNCSALTTFPTLNLGNMESGNGCFFGVTLTPDSYSNLLVALAAQNTNDSVTFHGGSSKYKLWATSARNTTLIATRTWIISDGGAATFSPFFFYINTANAGTSADNEFTLPLRVGLLYNFTIDWGDGSPPQIITTDTSPTHSYPSVNPYSIQITENVQGGFPAIHFNNGGDKLKLMSISNWGDVSWSTMEGAFYGCADLHILASDTPRTGNVTDFSSAWRECTYMPSFPAIDTANGTNFSNTWSGCTGLSSFPTLNMGKMTNGTNCFGGVTLSSASYSSLLIALATQNTAANNVTFSGGNSKFNSNAIASRAILTDPLRNWSITDGGIAPPVISSLLTASAEVGTPFTYQIVASNSPISYGASGLPAGLRLDVLSDTITGTAVSASVSSVTISASNTGGTDDETLTLTVTVDPLAPVISSALTASSIVNQPFSYQITASNTPTGFNATGLPVGLSVNTTTGVIDGTPTVLGTSLVTISATNADGGGIETLVLTIVAPGGGGGGGSGGGGGGGCGLGGGTAAGLLLGLARLTLLLRSTGGRQRD